MKSVFELQDQMFSWFCEDTELLALLGSPTTDEELNSKMRREIVGLDEVTPSIDFFAFYFPPSGVATGNFKVNKGVLMFDYFTGLRYNAQQISERVRAIIAEKSKGEVLLVSEGQVPSGIVGVFQYRQRYMPLVRG